MQVPSPEQKANIVLDVIRTRRVVRRYTDEPVNDKQIRAVLEAGRWATVGGNRRVHRYLAVRDPKTIRLIKLISPGMLGAPTAIILICLDHEAIEREQTQEGHASSLIDVGTQAMNMMVAAHALGLGSCPVTSFSQSGMSTLLDLPPTVTPLLMVLLGHPEPHKRVMRRGAQTRLTIDDLTYWERYGQKTS
jgi:nitroreductase